MNREIMTIHSYFAIEEKYIDNDFSDFSLNIPIYLIEEFLRKEKWIEPEISAEICDALIQFKDFILLAKSGKKKLNHIRRTGQIMFDLISIHAYEYIRYALDRSRELKDTSFVKVTKSSIKIIDNLLEGKSNSFSSNDDDFSIFYSLITAISEILY